MEKINRRIGAKLCFTLSSTGRKVGLAIQWSDGIELEIANFSNYHINTKVKEDSLGVAWYLNGFYGIPKISRRNESWNFLGRINDDLDASGCALSDFNEITT